MSPKSKTYGNTSIRSLKGADRVRLRPGVIFGSDDVSGCAHALFEIVSNATDEAKAGYGNRIEVYRFADHSIQVTDHGRGVPMDWNEAEQRWNWDLVYNELYAGGKMEDDGLYNGSLGLNGLGACATQYASAYFDVTSVRDGYEYRMHFEKGCPVGELQKKKMKGKDTGTTQHWLPDIDVFTDIDIPLEIYQEMLKEQSIVNAGVTYVLNDEASGETYKYCYPNGILGFLEETDNHEGLTEPFFFEGEGKGRDREDKPEYSVKASVAFCFSNKQQMLKYFHNSSWLEHGGSPDKAVKSAFVSVIDKMLKDRGKYNKNEKKVTFGDISDSLMLITNSFSTATSYENQTKKAINNAFIQQFMTDLIKTNLEIWFIEHKDEGEKALNQVLINKRSRESSESARITVKKKLMQKTDVTNKVKKFVDCRSKDPSIRELFICEGDSALGSLLTARNSYYQALMPIRGKILNLEKASLQQTFSSDVIMDLIRVIGCGVEIRGKKMPKDIPTFDMKKLNFNKIIVASDEDVDGSHIRVLVLTMLHRLCPQLIEEGHVYYAETPLFEITYGKGKTEKTYYAFTDAERDRIIRDKDPSKLKIQRSKGLGENDAETMAKFINPETRHLVQVTAEDAKTMEYYYDLFMGTQVEPRRQYIEENGHLYMDDLDLS